MITEDFKPDSIQPEADTVASVLNAAAAVVAEDAVQHGSELIAEIQNIELNTASEPEIRVQAAIESEASAEAVAEAGLEVSVDAPVPSVQNLVALLGAEPVPDIATLTAAKDAAAFVAQIFADPSVSDGSDSEVTAALKAEESAEPVVVFEPVPVHWPQAQEQHLQGQRILILGLGASGLAMARWCVRGGAQVIVADTREAPPQLVTLQAELPDAQFVAGALSAELVDGQSLTSVYRSPGLSPEAIAPVVNAARAIGLPVGGELDLFAMALQGLAQQHGYQPAVLGITGTNGKTTVTSLTGQLLEHAEMTVAVAGNIGPTLLDTLTAHIDGESLPQAWVLELSSFQLDGVHSFAPTAGAVLNITQDHLDWHGSLKAYADAKANIFGENGIMVLNREDPMVMAMLPAPTPVPGKRGKMQQRAHITFGGDMPRRSGDFGLEVVNGMTWLVRAHVADETLKSKNADDLYVQRMMPADALRIRGRHNAINALSALALATSAGCTLAPLLFGLREYRGEPHRVQPIGRVSDVEYFDDSKGTNVGATVAALSGLGPDHRIVVILGGLGKGQDFAPLQAPISRYARAAVLIGRDAPQIREALADCGVPLVDASTMADAVNKAAELAHAKDAVLLSPACASMDMFKDYAERAQQFVDAVSNLALDAGQQLEGQA